VTLKIKFQKRNSKIQLFKLWILDFLCIGIYPVGRAASRQAKQAPINKADSGQGLAKSKFQKKKFQIPT